MQPFFLYYGGKWRLADRLGPPQRDHVIEPFAGSAGYSVFWEPKKVTLIERDPLVAGVWKYLKRVTLAELRLLPSDIRHVDELPARVCEEAKSLIGFWFNHGLPSPAVRRSNWARNPRYAAFFWSETIKLRLASQVERIRHWKIVEGSWQDASDVEAHWHIDPPYQNPAGRVYEYDSVNRRQLAKWCRRRRGFVQVCENDGAKWLRFEPLSIVQTHRARGYTAEAVFEMEN